MRTKTTTLALTSALLATIALRPAFAEPIARETDHVHGHMSGLQRSWYRGGPLHQELRFVNDMAEGLHRAFTPQGALYREEVWREGRPVWMHYLPDDTDGPGSSSMVAGVAESRGTWVVWCSGRDDDAIKIFSRWTDQDGAQWAIGRLLGRANLDAVRKLDEEHDGYLGSGAEDDVEIVELRRGVREVLAATPGLRS